MNQPPYDRYDPECEKLAEYWLTDVVDLGVTDGKHKLIQSLAQHIQNAIEDWVHTTKEAAP